MVIHYYTHECTTNFYVKRNKMSRYIKGLDVKLLYSLSAGRCNLCGNSVFERKNSGDGYIHYGEMAHNVPYSNSDIAPRKIDKHIVNNSYQNLILLCSIHHNVIDQDDEYYTIERIQQIKSDFEEKIKNSLNPSQSLDASTINTIKSFVDLQYLASSLDDPLYCIPYDISDISMVYDSYLLKNYPTLYPFDDENLTRMYQHMNELTNSLHPYIVKYYDFHPIHQDMRPYKGVHQIFPEKDQTDIVNICHQLQNAIHQWLYYLRKNNI